MVDTDRTERPLALFGEDDVDLEGAGVGHLMGQLRQDIQNQCEGVVGGNLPGASVEQDDVAVLAALDLPPGRGVVVVFRESGEEEISAAYRGGEVWVGPAAEGDERRDGTAVGLDKKAKEWGWVERPELAAEDGGRTDGVEKGEAGEGGADEAREGGEAVEDLAEEIFVERDYGGGSGWWR